MVGLRRFRAEADRLRQVREGLVVVVLRAQQVGAAEIGGAVIGVGLDGAGKSASAGVALFDLAVGQARGWCRPAAKPGLICTALVKSPMASWSGRSWRRPRRGCCRRSRRSGCAGSRRLSEPMLVSWAPDLSSSIFRHPGAAPAAAHGLAAGDRGEASTARRAACESQEERAVGTGHDEAFIVLQKRIGGQRPRERHRSGQN